MTDEKQDAEKVDEKPEPAANVKSGIRRSDFDIFDDKGVFIEKRDR